MANKLMYSQNPLTGGWSINITKSPAYKQAIAMQMWKTQMNTFLRYVNLAVPRIAFDGMTKTMSERCAQETIVWYPLIALFKVGDSWVNLPAVPGGRGFNPEGNIADGYAYGRNGQVFHVSFKMPGENESSFLARTPGPNVKGEYKGYCLRANSSCYPIVETIVQNVEQIADLLQALKDCTWLLHHPINFSCDPKQRATALKWYKDVDNHMPFTFTPVPMDDTSRRPFSAEVVNLIGGTDTIKQIVETIDWWDQRTLTQIGIKNMGSQVDKKGENLTMAEVNGTDTVTYMTIQDQVNLINKQIDEMGINEEPGLENFRAKRGDEINGNDDLRSMDGSEPGDVAGESTGDNGPE